MSYFAASSCHFVSIWYVPCFFPANRCNGTSRGEEVGFREASALGLLFVPSTVCYQDTETQRELLPFEDVTFGVPHGQKKDYSVTNPVFLEEWHFPGVVVQFRHEDRQLSACSCTCAAHSLHFGPPAWKVCISCIHAASMVSRSPCVGRDDMFAPAVTPPCGSPVRLAHASSEQDTIDTTFDPPALTLTCFSSQTLPMKAFFVYFHCISIAIPESFLSLQWGFG